jgi:glycine cleavage system protein P-like pyridoxal-binding family
LGNALLVCATETKTQADIDAYARALDEVLSDAAAAAPVRSGTAAERAA